MMILGHHNNLNNIEDKVKRVAVIRHWRLSKLNQNNSLLQS